MKIRQMTAREVVRGFKRHWRQEIAAGRESATDKPAMRYAFSCFVDTLARIGAISDRVAQRVCLD